MSDIEAGAEEPNELPVKAKGRNAGVSHGLWVAALALANVIGAALLFFAVGKGVSATTQYDSCNTAPIYHGYYPTPSYAPSGTYQPVNPYQPANPYQPQPPSCDSPFARKFWGLAMAPLAALVVSSVLMTVLYARGRRLLAVIQTSFFVMVVGTSLFAATTLVNSGF